MNLTKKQKDVALVSLASFVLMAAIALTYFGLYAPAKTARLQSEQALASEKEVLLALQTQFKDMPEAQRINSQELQQRVALEPLTDHVMLQVEQAELISGTVIQSISFAEGLFELPIPVEGVENIEELTATVELEAGNYESIASFIEEIEAMKRIMVIEAIDFGAIPEQTQEITERQNLAVSLQFKAFYRTDLVELADSASTIDAPAPANKANPMPQNDGTYLVIEPDAGELDDETEAELSSEEDAE